MLPRLHRTAHFMDTRAGNQGQERETFGFTFFLVFNVFFTRQSVIIFSACIGYSPVAFLFNPDSVSIWRSLIVLGPDKFRGVILFRSFKSHINETLFVHPELNFICACMTKKPTKHFLPKQIRAELLHI